MGAEPEVWKLSEPGQGESPPANSTRPEGHEAISGGAGRLAEVVLPEVTP